MRLPYLLQYPRYAATRRRINHDWQDAADLIDLGHRTANWLTGHIPMHPYQPAPPDNETAPLIDRLAAYNHAGFLTLVSQPGFNERTGYDGATWTQRAALEALTDEQTARRVQRYAQGRDLDCCLRPPGSIEIQPAMTVTTRDGLTYTAFGPNPPELLRDMFHPCTRPTLLRGLDEAWQVIVADWEWNSSDHDRLWNMLDLAIGITQPDPALSLPPF